MTTKQMRHYHCPKGVLALEIERVVVMVDSLVGNITTLHFKERKFGSIEVSGNWSAQYNPHPGGYLIIASDGQQSFLPKTAFEGMFHD